ncbi:Alpha/Beta hydrolase protein [Emericellopsis atlantica]|uniref:Alpha/Beta hydrolase protein n=1 Tax=Emericellopsis atlantica TaxID=2614577 RepID=A0A9P7ZLY4_9HYPO|nr:Alpha/Beta hydrolase protein [Emericellopsis atlantica]KAG9254030.1 Alpha/Beta hydrolase protein [Emericellopsis atlantica]
MNSPRQTFKTARGHTYSLVHIPPRDSRPTLLLLHGFPSHLHDWVQQTGYLAAHGYGVLAPDLLGYGQTDQPSCPDAYRLKLMSDDIAEMAHALVVAGKPKRSTLVGVGHDFGATLLSRAAAYYPELWHRLVFLAVGPPRLGTPFDVDSINQMTRQVFGFELLGYIKWLATDPQAATTLESHAQAAMRLVFCADHGVWDEWYRPLGKMKEFCEQNRQVAMGEWYTTDLQRHHLECFARPGGYRGATMWYKMWTDNLFAEDEQGREEFRIQTPTLFVGAEGFAQQRDLLAAWCEDLTCREVDGGHWIHLEHAHRVNQLIKDFLE